jgi:hypothetical protein
MNVVHEVVLLEEPCAAGGLHAVSYVDTFQYGRRGVHEEVTCNRCHVVSSAQLADLPEAATLAVIRAYGEWEVRVAGQSRLKALAALREVRKLTLQEAKAAMTAQGSVFRGTHAAALLCAVELAVRGVPSESVVVERV